MAGRTLARAARWLGSWGAFTLALTLAALWAGTRLWPAAWWLEVRRVIVFDGPAAAPVIMTADRTIHRPFIARWDVAIWQWTGSGWRVTCAANGTHGYRPESELPVPLTLEWWTAGGCPVLAPGRYYVATVWTIHPAGPLPEKLILSDSNIFEIGG